MTPVAPLRRAGLPPGQDALTAACGEKLELEQKIRDLEETCRNLRQATASAANTARIACERLLNMEPVVKAAVACLEASENEDSTPEHMQELGAAMRDTIRAYRLATTTN